MWDDISPNFVGLSVQEQPFGPDDDQIAGSDALKIAFAQSVQLLGVGTLFDAGHDAFNPLTAAALAGNSALSSSISFWLSTTGAVGSFSPISFLLANQAGLNITSSTFYFMQDPNSASYACPTWNYPNKTCTTAKPIFNVSALKVYADNFGNNIPEVPLPAALPLFMGGLGGLGLLTRLRRLRSNSSAVAA